MAASAATEHCATTAARLPLGYNPRHRRKEMPVSELDVVPPPGGKANDRRTTRQRLVLYATGGVIATLALVALGIYAWNFVTVGRLRAGFEAERARSSTAQKQALTGQARALLRLSARPLAWSVRGELLRGNLGQIDDYFREFVRERGVSSLLLVDKDGRIALATNRKLETQPADSVLSKALLESPDVAFEEAGTALRMAVPVMGFDRRLGTLVVDYDTTAP
jgi:hypothetical protein